MPPNDVDAIAEVAALCTTARAKLPASGFHRLRILLDMILIDLSRESAPPKKAAEVEAEAASERGQA